MQKHTKECATTPRKLSRSAVQFSSIFNAAIRSYTACCVCIYFSCLYRLYTFETVIKWRHFSVASFFFLCCFYGNYLNIISIFFLPPVTFFLLYSSRRVKPKLCLCSQIVKWMLVLCHLLTIRPFFFLPCSYILFAIFAACLQF